VSRPAPAHRGLLVLAYHAISSDWDDPLSLAPETFRSQLESLAASGYRGVTFSEAATSAATEKRVAVTFDDAFASAAVHAPPVLDELGWPATVFAPTVPVETQEPMRWLGSAADDRVRVAMTWGDLNQLADNGWEIGSHTRTHRRLSELRDDELGDELGRSREEIEAHVGRCSSISYPWGEVSRRVVDAARADGYETGSGLGGRFRFGDPMAVPRVALARGDGALGWRLKTSPLTWNLRSSAVWVVFEGVRGLARR